MTPVTLKNGSSMAQGEAEAYAGKRAHPAQWQRVCACPAISESTRTAITQEAFDEAVSVNIEDFDMPREEAIKSAIEEFNVQGYDLSGVVTNMAGSDVQRCVQRLTFSLALKSRSNAKGLNCPAAGNTLVCSQYVTPHAHGTHTSTLFDSCMVSFPDTAATLSLSHLKA